jgi:hypothetical protein
MTKEGKKASVVWRDYRTATLTQLHANMARMRAEPDADQYMQASYRLAEALHPAFVVWLSQELGQHESEPEAIFTAFSRSMPWLFLHLGELIQGTNGPEFMARGLLQAMTAELEAIWALPADEQIEEAVNTVAGTA